MRKRDRLTLCFCRICMADNREFASKGDTLTKPVKGRKSQEGKR